MRISDWSSDVCSSDLRPCQVVEAPQPRTQFPAHAPSPADPRYPAQGGSRRGAVSGLCRCAVAGRPTLRPGNIVVLDDFSSHKSKAVGRELGRASCRERVCQAGLTSVGPGAVKKKRSEYKKKT